MLSECPGPLMVLDTCMVLHGSFILELDHHACSRCWALRLVFVKVFIIPRLPDEVISIHLYFTEEGRPVQSCSDVYPVLLNVLVALYSVFAVEGTVVILPS